MSKRNITLVVALVVLALLGGGYYGATAMAKKKAESAYTPPAEYTSLELGNLESSELVKIEVPGIALEKKDEVWELSFFDGTIPPGIELDQRQILILTYSLASLRVERIIDEDPDGLSAYGLDNPQNRTMVTDSAGRSASYLLGDMTPSRTSFYIMEDGDPKVYSVSAYQAEFLRFTLDGIRQRTLFPNFEFTDLGLLQLDDGESWLEIVPKPESVPVYLASGFTSYVMTSPYQLPRGVDSEALQNFLKPLGDLTVEDFIEDFVEDFVNDPSSLSPYGLDKPLRIFLEAADNTLNLAVGNQIDGKRYAKLADSPSVFTLNGLEGFFNLKPISLIDKFALIINIATVDHLTITAGERNLIADLFNPESDPAFFLNSKKANEKSFRSFYEKVISLRIEAELPKTESSQPDRYSGPSSESDRDITIEYRLNTPPGARVSFTLIPYNRDFYALLQEGTTEFLISRNQVRSIFDAADAMVYE